MRDKFFPTTSGLIELPGPRYDGELTEYILQRYRSIMLEVYRGASFLRGGDVMVGKGHVFLGGSTWNYLLERMELNEARSFLRDFFGKEPLVLPGELIPLEDIPVPCLDLDSYLTILGENYSFSR